jgi:hypothetical protein
MKLWTAKLYSVGDKYMCMEHWWIDIDRGNRNPNNGRKTCPTEGSGFEDGACVERKANNQDPIL